MVVLTWLDGDGTACVRRWLDAESRLAAPLRLQGANYAYAVTWLAPDRIAVRMPGRRDAPAFDLAAADERRRACRWATYIRCPRPRSRRLSPTAQCSRRTTRAASVAPSRCIRCRSTTSRGAARRTTSPAAATSFAAWLIDSHDNTTVWHRLYAEAAIPAHTGFVVWLAATNDPRPPASDELAAWHPHGFGATSPRSTMR